MDPPAFHPRRVALAADEVHVWIAPEPTGDAGLEAAYEALLSDGERERAHRLRFAAPRRQYLAGRALLRCTLSRYAGIGPRAWAFETNAHGRPELAAGQTALPLRFNVSHADGLLACAVTLGRDVGVDVECRERPGDTGAIAERFFASAERDDLRRLGPDERRRRFFEYWTLKEAYLKARGVGMAIPLHEVSFHLDPPPIRVSLGAAVRDDPTDWQFVLIEPAPAHCLAVAVRRPAGAADLRVVVATTTPLAD